MRSHHVRIGNSKRLYGESNEYLDDEFPLVARILLIAIRPE